VRLTKTDEGFSVACPGLPGCWSQGQTEEEALANIQDAMRDYLGVRDEGSGQTTGHPNGGR
ncbi:MAG TPA: type II toxin-antitoxin system HicB family antitoxin, partial [Vicinamibacterales bacterium]|nr:type II toxin-antitoxin system HicB family antitoxin [Vicinamibacterales bacterium]